MFTELKHNRLTILILGKVNSGKSSFFNFIINQKLSIVSNIFGTTSDPIFKAIEFSDFGSTLLIDSAGLLDNSILKQERETKTYDLINMADVLAITIDSNNFNKDDINILSNILFYAKIKSVINVIFVISKIDLSNSENIEKIKFNIKDFIQNNEFKDKIKFEFFEISILQEYIKNQDLNSFKNNENFKDKRDLIISNFEKTLSLIVEKENNKSMLKNFIAPNDMIVSVISIDSETPKKRLILPQIEVIRDILDNSGISINLTIKEYEYFIKKENSIRLVIADSSIAKEVFSMTPKNIDFITFSILYAFYKSDFELFLYMINSTNAINSLVDYDKVLISESCTHHSTKDDIGKQKIPELIKKFTGKNINFNFCHGVDFPKNLEEYKLIIQCGGCMVNNNIINSRIKKCVFYKIPITNYGMIITKCNSDEIFNKAINFFFKKNNKL